MGGHRRHEPRPLRAVIGESLQDLLIGGDQIGQSTLLRFYALHVAVLPIAVIVLLSVHIWRVRKDGFAVERSSTGAFEEEATAAPANAVPATRRRRSTADGPECWASSTASSVTADERTVDDTVFTWPHLIVRHVVVALGVAVVVSRRGGVRRAAAGAGEPNLTPEPAKGPVVLRRAPGVAVALRSLGGRDPRSDGRGPHADLLLPYIDRNRATEARHRKVAIVIFTTVLVIAVALTIIGTFFRGPGWEFIAPWTHSYVEL